MQTIEVDGSARPASTALVSRRQQIAGLLALLAVTTAIYWAGLGGGYAFDDFPNIVNNPALHVTRLVWNQWLAAMLSSPASALQRPLAMLSFAINHYFTGLDPRPMKLTNLCIHLLNAVLVYGLIRSLLRAARELPCSPPRSGRFTRST